MTDSKEILADIASGTVVLARQIERLDRRAFRGMLAELLRCAPTEDAIKNLAERHPDRWAQAVSIAAGLAGYERGVTVNVNTRNVDAMGDAQLLEYVREMQERLRSPLAGREVVDAEVVREPGAE